MASLLPPGAAVHPLRHWPDASLRQASASLLAPWKSWCERWGLDRGFVEAANVEDVDTPPGSWRTIGRGAWLAGSPAPSGAIGAALFGGAPETPLAADVVARALVDLEAVLALGAAEAGTPDAPPVAELRRWSGGLHLSLSAVGPSGGLKLVLHAGPDLAQRLSGQPAPIARAAALRPAPLAIAQAVAARRVRLRVEANPVSLTLGTLQSLRVGDIVPLAHRLDQPLQVVDAAAPAGAKPVCAAWLGARGVQRAVELVPATPASNAFPEP